MESFEQQEERAMRRFRPWVAVKSALIAGVIAFVFPAGGPWMSTEAFYAVMGRIVTASLPLDLLLQLLLALLYGYGIGRAIYSLPPFFGILAGALLGFPLYAVNYFVFAVIFGVVSNELHACLAHLVFALAFSTIYRAMAVPPPRMN